jgi:hypothetical protein
MPENSKKIKSKTSIITSPDGVRIKITEGRKLQQIREYARDPLITDAQFRLLAVMTDRTNEGYGSDETKWGYSYANYETLGDDTAKTPSAVKRMVQELETGKREVGTGKKKEIKECKVALSVKRDSRPGRSKVNHYWQPDLNRIAAVEETEKGPAARPFPEKKGPVSDEKGSGFSDERVRFSGQKGPAARPDSSFTDSPQRHTSQDSKSAYGVCPDDSSIGRKKEANDNKPVDIPKHKVPPDEVICQAFEALWNVYPRSINRDEAYEVFREIALTGSVTLREIIDGAKIYKQSCPELKYTPALANWLRKKRWGEFKNAKKNTCRAAI